MLELLSTGFLTILTNPVCLLLILLGVVVGLIFGSIPGLTTVAGIAMFLPLTYAMDVTLGISMLTAIYIGGCSGGLISAILLNIPGTPASIATCFDGRPMAEKGEAGKALGIAIFASFVGTMVGVLAMTFVSPWLAKFTIKFGPWEYFGVTLFALTLISNLCGKNIIKGFISAIFGMMFATVGLAPIDSAVRFTFGNVDLSSGFNLLPVLVGLYAISEVLNSSRSIGTGKDMKIQTNYKIKGLGFTLQEMKSQIVNFIRSSFVGLGIGILPGIGGSTSNIIAYSVSKNLSKHPEKYGTGIIDGVVASESSNNASVGGAMIPLLTLGIPGDGVTAILLGGFMLHGLTPGPLLFQNNGSLVYSIFAAMIIASFVMLVVMYSGLRGFIQILKMPKRLLLPLVIVLCCVGAFAINNRMFDVWGILIFGLIGYGLSWFEYPLPPFILGFILEGTFELNLRRGLDYSQGNFFDLFTKPIAAFFVIMTIASLLYTVFKMVMSNGNSKHAAKTS